MWIFTLAMAWGDPIDPPIEQATISDIHSDMDEAIKRAMAPPLRIKTSSPAVIACPKDTCQRINHTQQETYNHTVLESGWLSMANRYGTGSVLIPNPESTKPRRFLTWSTDVRNLWILIDSGTPTAYFATWTLNRSNQLGTLLIPIDCSHKQTVDHWLSECNPKPPSTSTIDKTYDLGVEQTAMDGTCGGRIHSHRKAGAIYTRCSKMTVQQSVTRLCIPTSSQCLDAQTLLLQRPFTS